MYEDQTAVYAFSEAELEPPDVGAEEIWRSYVNTLGPSAEASIQLDTIEWSEADDLEALTGRGDEDIVLDDQIEQINIEGEEAVPSDWRYWEHDENTLPPVNEANAPPMPSGWVDPDTDELVP